MNITAQRPFIRGQNAALWGETQCPGHAQNLQFRSPLSVCFPPSRRRRMRLSSSAPAIRTEKSRRRAVPTSSAFEIELADDFVLTSTTRIDSATFTGLMPVGATPEDVVVEIYRVFPNDSISTEPAGPRRSRRERADAGQLAVRRRTRQSRLCERRASPSRPTSWRPALQRTTLCNRAASIPNRTKPLAGTAQRRALRLSST